MKNLLIAFGLLCSSVALTSCAADDWKEEIARLQEELNVQKELLEASQNNVYITHVETTDEGVVLTLSDGRQLEVRNGANGADGTDGATVTDISMADGRMTFTFSDGATIVLTVDDADANEVCLPAYLYMLSDTRNDMFVEPFVKRWKPYDYSVVFNGSFYSRRLERVASVDHPENNQRVIVNLFELAHFSRVDNATSRIRVGEKGVGSGKVVAQIIGDSFTQGAFYKDALLRQGYVPGVQLVGLRSVKVETDDDVQYTAGQYDEGRNGACLSWYFDVFTGDTRYHGFMQPDGNYRYWGTTGFWKKCFLAESGSRPDLEAENGKYGACLSRFSETGYLKQPAEGDILYDSDTASFVVYDGNQWNTTEKSNFTWNFDYGKYLAMWNIEPPKFLAEMLGLNDFRNNVNADFSEFNRQLEVMKNSYLKAVPDGKFIVLIPSSTCGVMANNAGNFTLMQNFAMWRFRKNLIDTFDKRESEGYYLVDIGITIDNEDGYYYDEEGMQTNQPHPYKNYPTMGIPLAAFLQYHR